MGQAFLEDCADLVNEKVAEGVLDKIREMAKGLLEDGVPMEIVVRRTGLSEDIVRNL